MTAGPGGRSPGPGHATLSGAVIAGGRSTRMGRDKRALALVPGGPTLAESTARLVGLVADDVLVVTGDEGPFAGLGLRIVPDVPGFEGAGPLAGIGAALTAARAERVLCVAADMPFLEEALLRLLARIAALEPDADAVVPISSGEGRGAAGARAPVPGLLGTAEGVLEPLCAVYRRRAGPAMLAALARGERSPARLLRDAAAGIRVRPVPPAEWAAADPRGRSFRDLDTPADLEAVQEESRESDADGIIVPG